MAANKALMDREVTMTANVNQQPSRNHTSDMLEVWRVEHKALEEKHQDLERDYWQLQGQYSELQSQHRQILRLLSTPRS